MTTPPAIEVRNLDFAYRGDPVLVDVSFAVGEREFISIVGPNGGGKTTLLRILLGLLKPDSGTVRVLGAAPSVARRRVGYLAQSTQLDRKFPVTVMDVVLMGRLGHTRAVGPFRRVDRQIALGALTEVGLTEAAGRAFSTLSGGERQRVLIARALACEPEILMLDEPTTNLDQRREAGFYALLATLARRLTVVLVSHDLGFVSSHVTRAICVNREVHVHPTAEIDDELIRSIYGDGVRLVRHDRDVERDAP